MVFFGGRVFKFDTFKEARAKQKEIMKKFGFKPQILKEIVPLRGREKKRRVKYVVVQAKGLVRVN